MALVQLACGQSGAGNAAISGNTCTPECANLRDSIMHWFVAREDGVARAEDAVHAKFLDLVPWRVIERPSDCFWQRDRNEGAFQPSMQSCVQHAPGLRLPFDVRRERMAARIQCAWRRAIACPEYSLCRARLKREFEGLSAANSGFTQAQQRQEFIAPGRGTAD